MAPNINEIKKMLVDNFEGDNRKKVFKYLKSRKFDVDKIKPFRLGGKVIDLRPMIEKIDNSLENFETSENNTVDYNDNLTMQEDGANNSLGKTHEKRYTNNDFLHYEYKIEDSPNYVFLQNKVKDNTIRKSLIELEKNNPDRYHEMKFFGKQGAMGAMILAKDRKAYDSSVLIKVPKDISNSNSLIRFRKEAKATRIASEKATSNHLVDLHIKPGDAAYSVQKRLSDRSISGADYHLRAGNKGSHLKSKYSLDDIVSTFTNLVKQMDILSHEGLIHRDIKPDNFLVDPDFNTTDVLDWGLTKILDDDNTLEDNDVRDRAEAFKNSMTLHDVILDENGNYSSKSRTKDNKEVVLTMNAMGTPLYMSSEQADSERLDQVSHQTDIYSLGGVLYYMLTGTDPRPLSERGRKVSGLPGIMLMKYDGSFSENLDYRRIRKLKKGKALEGMIKKMMAFNLDERYQDYGEIVDDINKWKNDEDLSCYEYSKLDKFKFWVKNQTGKAVGAGAGALFAIALIAGGIGFMNYQSGVELKEAETRLELKEKEQEKQKSENEKKLALERAKKKGLENKLLSSFNEKIKNLFGRRKKKLNTINEIGFMNNNHNDNLTLIKYTLKDNDWANYITDEVFWKLTYAVRHENLKKQLPELLVNTKNEDMQKAILENCKYFDIIRYDKKDLEDEWKRKNMLLELRNNEGFNVIARYNYLDSLRKVKIKTLFNEIDKEHEIIGSKIEKNYQNAILEIANFLNASAKDRLTLDEILKIKNTSKVSYFVERMKERNKKDKKEWMEKYISKIEENKDYHELCLDISFDVYDLLLNFSRRSMINTEKFVKQINAGFNVLPAERKEKKIWEKIREYDKEVNKFDNNFIAKYKLNLLSSFGYNLTSDINSAKYLVTFHGKNTKENLNDFKKKLNFYLKKNTEFAKFNNAPDGEKLYSYFNNEKSKAKYFLLEFKYNIRKEDDMNERDKIYQKYENKINKLINEMKDYQKVISSILDLTNKQKKWFNKTINFYGSACETIRNLIEKNKKK